MSAFDKLFALLGGASICLMIFWAGKAAINSYKPDAIPTISEQIEVDKGSRTSVFNEAYFLTPIHVTEVIDGMTFKGIAKTPNLGEGDNQFSYNYVQVEIYGLLIGSPELRAEAKAYLESEILGRTVSVRYDMMSYNNIKGIVYATDKVPLSKKIREKGYSG